MEGDPLINQVDTELSGLQGVLKDRLKETTELGDLNQDVFKSSMKIEKHTASLEKTATQTKWKWFFEYAKWMIIAGAVITILLFILLKMLPGKK